MKLVAYPLLFALTVSAQAATDDSIVSRLDSTLQAIDTETGPEPISLVIAVQANNKIQPAILIDTRRIRSMLTQLIGSERAEVEVLSYGDRVRVLVAQPFTSDSAKAADAMAYLKISTGQSSTSTTADAITQAATDLETRPSNRRRIIVVLGENSNDRESAAKLKDTVNRAAGRLPNLVVYFPLALR